MENLSKEIILEVLHKNKDVIREFGVKKLILFGSYAKGEQKNTSDIDFLVEFEKKRSLFDDYVGLLHFLEDTFNKKIDLGKMHLIRDELREDILSGVQYAAEI